jgi:hypothetical protein
MELLRTNLAFTFGDMYSHIRSFARFTSYPVPHARQVAMLLAVPFGPFWVVGCKFSNRIISTKFN